MTTPATLNVGSWSSTCGVCGKSANPNEAAHLTLLGYGPENGSPGCGAVWTHVTSTYVDKASQEATRRLRPDLEFIGFEYPISLKEARDAKS